MSSPLNLLLTTLAMGSVSLTSAFAETKKDDFQLANIFGGSSTMAGVLIALLVLAFVQNALGLAGGATSSEGAVLIVTLIAFGSSEGPFSIKIADHPRTDETKNHNMATGARIRRGTSAPIHIRS